MMTALLVLGLLCLLSSLSVAAPITAHISPVAVWNQPIIPSRQRQKGFTLPVPTNPGMYMHNTTRRQSPTNTKRIPRYCWIAFCQQPNNATMKDHTRKMLERNYPLGWDFHLSGNAEKLAFMRKYFANTSTLQAYESIHESVGTSAADIWRYSALYLFGGLYLDDDSYLEAKYDDVIGKNDSLIVSTEKNPYRDECYHEDFHLSAVQMKKCYPSGDPGVIHGGRVIVSWGIFAQPYHPIVYRSLENIIELIRFEYFRQSPLIVHLRNHAKWMVVMCATGPTAFTASQREMLLHYGPDLYKEIVVHKRDFHQYGGVFKIFDGDKKTVEKHYMHTMQAFNIPMLNSYFNQTQQSVNKTTSAISSSSSVDSSEYNGKLVTSDGKELFYVMHNARRGFRDWDAFTGLHMLHHTLIRTSSEDLKAIPLSPLPPLSLHDAELIKQYQHKMQKIAQKRNRQHAEHFVEDETYHYQWPRSWPTLKHSFLAHLEPTWKTYNVSVVDDSV